MALVTPSSLPILAAAVLLLVVGGVVYFTNRNRLLNVSFLGLCFSGFTWHFFSFLACNTIGAATAFFWYRYSYIGIIFIAFTFYHYITVFLGRNRELRLVVRSGYLLGVVASALAVSTPLVISNVYRYHWGYYPLRGVLHPVFLCFFLSYIAGGAYLLLRELIASRDTLSSLKRTQITYILLALVIFNFASLDFLANYSVAVRPFGYLPTLFFIGIIAYAVARHHLMEIRVATVRAVILTALYVVVLGLPFYAAYVNHSDFLSVSLMFFLATAGPVGYRYLQRKADNILLAEQRRYQQVLVQAAGGMTKEHDLQKLVRLIVYIVKRSVKVSFVAIYVADKGENAYRLTAFRGESPGARLIGDEDPFCVFLRTTKNPLLVDDVPASVLANSSLPPRTNLIVPSFFQKELIGFLLLGEKLNGKSYSSDDINVFKILASQTALAVENCFFMENFRKTQERLFTAEKLAAVGGLADGVAHQMKNRLNQFSVAAGEQNFEINDFIEHHGELVASAPGLKETLFYLRDIADSVRDNVFRTNEIIQGILNFSRIESKEDLYSLFPLQDILEPSVQLLKIKHNLKDFPLRYEVSCSDLVYGVKSQLLECLYNLLDNAYEAIEERAEAEERKGVAYVPSIAVSLSRDEERGTGVILVRDNGSGIKEEDAKKVFAPFFTTKPSVRSGTGIGMYIVKRIIEENHSGRIWFKSLHGEGTSFFVELPGRGKEG